MGKLQDLATGTTSGFINQKGIYKTDKVDHGYMPLYEKYLPKKVNKFMECGVWMGDGLRLFREYYNSKGEFHAMDYFAGGLDEVEKQLQSEGFITHKGSDDDVKFLATIKEQFTVIAEDCSHHSDSQIILFKQLFLNNIEPGGIYVAEDLHCCTEAYWWRGKVNGYDNTLLAAFQRVIAGGDFTSQMFTQEESDLIKSQISEIHLELDKICFIKKK